YGTLGNQREVERARKLLELKLLESPVKPELAAGAAHQYLFIASLSDDLTWLKQLIPEIEAVASIHPTFRTFATFAPAEVGRVCGDFATGLAIAHEALAQIRPGQSPLWAWIVGRSLHCMIGLGRFEETRDVARRELAVAEAIGLDALKDHIELPLALAEAKLG